MSDTVWTVKNGVVKARPRKNVQTENGNTWAWMRTEIFETELEARACHVRQCETHLSNVMKTLYSAEKSLAAAQRKLEQAQAATTGAGKTEEGE